MRIQQPGILIPAIGASVLWVVLAAVGLPAFATFPALLLFLAIYARLAVRLISLQSHNDHLQDVTRAIEIAGRARHLAILDPNTDLLARWYFELRLEGEAQRCLRYNEQVAVVLLRPTSANMGDLAASEAAGAVLRGVRQTDLVGSLDEAFALCLLHCDLPRAELVANRLAYKLGAGWQAGVAVIPDDAHTGKDALKVATKQLDGSNVSAA